MTVETHPTLLGPRVTIRPGDAPDALTLHTILLEPSVYRWWREPDPLEEIEQQLRGTGEERLLVIDVAGQVAGGIQYYEELEPDYRHAAIDIFLGSQWQGRRLGTESIWLLARFLFEQRGHHRLTIDPSSDNARAIASYSKVGFKPVGLMRQYERQADGTWHDGLLMDLLRHELPASLEHPPTK
jgi:aminoglycoside 6'-N-acetyltransferase